MPTEEKWDKMRDEKQINIQTLACLHDAVAIGIYAKDVSDGNLKAILDMLYEIAENKKAEITTSKPVDLTKAEELGEQWKKDQIEAERIRIGAKYQEAEETIEQ